MKKLFVYLLIVFMFGAVFGIILSNNNNMLKEQVPVVGTVLEAFVIPAAAYAQDTGNTATEPPPAIPRDP
jgi:hypothetical protein